MNKFIYYPLILLFMITVFTQLINIGSLDFDYEGSQEQGLEGSQTLNAETSTLELESGSLSLDYTLSTGIIIITVSAIALGLIGLNVFGSGLSSFSVKIIWNGIVFYGLWLIFSVTGFNFFSSIPHYVGAVFWIGLTLVYSLGVFEKMGSGGE